MANPMIRHEPTQSTGLGLFRDFDPIRQVRDLFRWEPWTASLADLFREMPRMFHPDFEVKETQDAFVVRADVPGVREADLDITLTGNRLTISGKREAEKEEKGETYYHVERQYGSFTRTFMVPEGIKPEACRAEMHDGVLMVTLPKTAEAATKKIPVKAGNDKAKA